MRDGNGGQKKMSWKKPQKCNYPRVLCRRKSINIRVKFYLNHATQEPDIYISNIPDVSEHDKIHFNENQLTSADHRLGNTGLVCV